MSDIQGPRIVGIGSIFIDDIVLANGQTHMAQLGGGVVHAMMGAAIWGERPGIVATVGHGLPSASETVLKNNFDTRGLVQLELPQIRAWQLFEEDGTRRELYRVKETLPFVRGAQPAHFPMSFVQCNGYYLLQSVEDVRAWRKLLTGFMLWEPLQQTMIPENAYAVREILTECHINLMSPNLVEAKAIYGDIPAEELVSAMLGDGAQIVALRMGEAGSILGDQTGRRIHVGTVSTKILDQTGAGNTYCGALLAGLIADKSLEEAAAMAAVAASFCLEQIGVALPQKVSIDEREARFEQVLSKVTIFH